ncbi:MAG: serine--tRNA ligase, partial [Alphaproteobacteria bacterium]|nr:serine--tRNA ligase [Alphaproteobacteria bacterium]
MHDIKAIRDNPENFDAAMKRRGLEAASPALLKLDEERRGVQTSLQELQQRRNDESRKIGEIKKSGGNADEAMKAVAALKDEMAALEERERTLGEALNQHLAGLPNILAADVPDGADENDNVELRAYT